MATTRINGARQIIDNTIYDLQISDTAAIQTIKLADGAKFIQSDGSVDFTAVQVGITPTADNHLTTKAYVDGVAQNLQIKDSVRASSAGGDITLSGLQTVDGVVLADGDRILVKDQADATENGIYIVSAVGWTRSTDADEDAEVTAGMFTFVEEGTQNADTGWVLATDGAITIGGTSLSFTQFSASGAITAGLGLTKTGSEIDVISANGGIVTNANNIELTVDGTSLAITASGIKLAGQAAGTLLVGDAGGEAAAVTISGDVNIDSAGASTLNLGNGQFFIGDAGGTAQNVTISGAITIDNAGVASFTATDILQASAYVVREVPVGLINGANTTYTIANVPVASTEMLFRSGMLQDVGAGNDYTIAGNTITTADAPIVGEKLLITYFK